MGKQFGEPITLDIAPGFYTEDTDTSSMGRWIDGDLVRWKNGLAQSIGGWVKQTLNGSLLGIPRSIHDWTTLDGTKYVAVGTEKRLYVIEEDFTVNNVTPVRDSGTLGVDPISTDSTGAYDPNATGDASFVSIEDTSHGVAVGDVINLTGATAVGGIIISGDYEVKSVTDTNNYIIQHSADATSTATGGGAAVDYIYEITAGTATSGVLSGWGTMSWGDETWDTPRTDSNFVGELRTWSLDNWGEDLIASPKGGAIYVWDASSGFGTRATIISQAPSTNLRVLVSESARQIISLGAHNGSASDPLFIAWCDSEDYTNWTPDITNTAGDKRIDQGSEIITGVQSRGGIVIFTDTGAHILQAVGAPNIYETRKLGGAISIASPSAAVDVSGVLYAMAKTNFYVYDGTLRVLPCDVWTKIYDREKSAEALNQNQTVSVFCSHVKNFNEVWWFYPSQGEVTNDRYVVYNYLENAWYYGALSRASFSDFSEFAEAPYGFDESGNLYTHEDGNDADGVAMTPYLMSGYLEIADGDQLMHISKLIPDFDRLTGDVHVTLYGKKWPQSTAYTKGPYSAGPATDEMGVRIRARHIAMYINQDGLGESFRMGSWRARVVPDGER